MSPANKCVPRVNQTSTMRFVGNYALCGLAPQTDGMPVIHKKPSETLKFQGVSLSLVVGIMLIKRLYPLKSTHSQLSFSTPCPAHVLQIFPLHCYAYCRIHRHRYPVSYVCLYVPATFLIPPAEHPPLCTLLRTYVSEHAVL